jgi:ASC-1-like (ASCH) protein
MEISLIDAEVILLMLYAERKEIVRLLPENASETDRECAKAQIEVLDRLYDKIVRKEYGVSM